MTVKDVNADNWEKEVMASNVLTLVEFWHENCPRCLRLSPILDELADEFKDRVRFLRLNVLSNSDNRETAIHHGVMGTPTVMFFLEGRNVGTMVGLIEKDNLRETIIGIVEKQRI